MKELNLNLNLYDLSASSVKRKDTAVYHVFELRQQSLNESGDQFLWSLSCISVCANLIFNILLFIFNF
jgi:hypothetical protein